MSLNQYEPAAIWPNDDPGPATHGLRRARLGARASRAVHRVRRGFRVRPLRRVAPLPARRFRGRDPRGAPL